MAALHKVAEEFKQQYPEAAERIKKHTYVDDLTSVADSAKFKLNWSAYFRIL